MVDYREYGVVWTILWELCDEVHRYFFKWVCLGVGSDAIRRGVYSVRQVFVLLTGGAPFDVVFDPLVHAEPLVLSFCSSYGLVSSQVSGSRGVVIVVHDLPPQIRLRWYHYSMASEPLGVLQVFILGEVEVVSIPPFFHFFASTFLGLCNFLF